MPCLRQKYIIIRPPQQQPNNVTRNINEYFINRILCLHLTKFMHTRRDVLFACVYILIRLRCKIKPFLCLQIIQASTIFWNSSSTYEYVIVFDYSFILNVSAVVQHSDEVCFASKQKCNKNKKNCFLFYFTKMRKQWIWNESCGFL